MAPCRLQDVPLNPGAGGDGASPIRNPRHPEGNNTASITHFIHLFVKANGETYQIENLFVALFPEKPKIGFIADAKTRTLIFRIGNLARRAGKYNKRCTTTSYSYSNSDDLLFYAELYESLRCYECKSGQTL